MTVNGKKEIIKSICDFSYDVLAAKQMFQDNLCGEIFVLTLLFIMKHQTPFNLSEQEAKKLKSDFLTILTQELMQYEKIKSCLEQTFPQFMNIVTKLQAENMSEHVILQTIQDKLEDLIPN